MELKDILKNLREQKQVSMDKMCEDLYKQFNMPLAKSTISKWENGKAEPNLAYARVLTKYFNVTLDFLLGLENERIYTFNKISKKEESLLLNYDKLNDLGKNEATKRVEELTYVDKYIKDDETCATVDEDDYLMPIAAHNDDLTDSEKEEMNRRIAEIIEKRKMK